MRVTPVATSADRGNTQPVPAPVRHNGHVSEPSKVNILLVDDRADKLLAVEAILSPLGQNIVQARSGKEALRQLLARDFAVVLLDVAMPGMDGLETAAMIRKRPRSEHTPIIFITSISNSENSVFQGYSLGAVDYIMTPIAAEVLRTKVSVLVELHQRAELIRQQAEQLRIAEEARHRRELAAAADQLEAETKRNRFFTLALDLLAIADFKGHLLQVNPAWEKVLGYSCEELRSVSGLDLTHPDDYAAMADQLERLRNGNAAAYFEGRYRHKDGSYRWLGWTAAPFASEQLIYIFARDITSRKAAEDEIRKLNIELKLRVNDLTEVNKELEAFNYSISHDLRAPLRTISSFTQVVQNQSDETLSGEARDYLRRVENAAKYMDRLLMDLLDYSRLTRSEFELSVVSIESAVDDVVFSIDHEIRSREAEIQIDRPLGFLVGHPATVRQMLCNLINNSLKFVAPSQRPRIRIRAERRDDVLRVWVEDNGLGIAAQYHKKIFGLFQRLHSREAYPGTGIGLAMVQKGVERMGGRIGVEAELGLGSRFWFELPRAEAVETEQLLSINFRRSA